MSLEWFIRNSVAATKCGVQKRMVTVEAYLVRRRKCVKNSHVRDDDEMELTATRLMSPW